MTSPLYKTLYINFCSTLTLVCQVLENSLKVLYPSVKLYYVPLRDASLHRLATCFQTHMKQAAERSYTTVTYSILVHVSMYVHVQIHWSVLAIRTTLMHKLHTCGKL